MRADLPPDLASDFRDIKRRLESLERSPKAWAPGTVRELQYRPAGGNNYDNPINVTSGTFVGVWEFQFRGITHDAFEWESLIVCPAGTTAEHYLEIATDGALTDTPTSAVTETQIYRSWRVDMSDEWTVGDLFTGIQVRFMVRRTSGAGNVNVYAPVTVRCAHVETINAEPWSTVSPYLYV